ncbi:MAG: hypothetical protein IKC23_13480 [Fibrobacter sp.]|nr:hypothetical protein [Fibrobacter sp.]
MSFLKFLPSNATITKLVIVGPYPSYTFVSSLMGKRGINKDNLFVVADDAWDVDELIDNNIHTQKVCSTLESGIVHAKMYFMKCVSDNGGDEFIQLVVGSANASVNGMEKNAENMSSYIFHIENDSCNYKSVRRYFDRLSVGKYVNSRNILLNSNEKLFLPKIQKSTSKQSFSSWLRSGKLFYQYAYDSNFGVISIRLDPALPPSIKWREKGAFKEKDNESISELKHRYLGKDGLTKKGKQPRNNALAKYAVETNHGRWVSKECYKKIQKLYDKPRNALKKALDEAMNSVEKDAHDLYLGIQDLIVLNKDNKKVVKSLQKISEESILETMKLKIKKDMMKCQNEAFCTRYASGYESYNVPNLSSEEWDNFVESWFASCMMKNIHKKGLQNVLAKTVRQLVSTTTMKARFSKIDPRTPLSPETLGKWFCANDWNKIKYTPSQKTLKDKITGYFKK